MDDERAVQGRDSSGDADPTGPVSLGRPVWTMLASGPAAGGTILVPRGARHHVRTLAEPSRTLILIVPAGLEGFFREMTSELAAGRTPLEAMTSLSQRYDSHPVD